MTQESQMECDVNLYFVIQNKYESENDCNDDMWSAFNKCVEDGLSPLWITEKGCKKLQPVKKDVFILEEFSGETFKRLQTFKCSIVGPRCLLTCFINGESIPEGTSPVFNTAMRGLIISISGLSVDKKEIIKQKIEYMGGIFTKQLRNCTTHLITDSVMSMKYEKATELKIPTYTENWVYDVWKTNLEKFVKADDISFNKHKTPVFLNLVVTSTNISKFAKEEIRNLINKNGGNFMGPLDGSKVKVVIAPEDTTLSEKLKYAMENNIACLKVEWVYKSIKAGFALPFKDYIIKSTKATSTPERVNALESFNISSISRIPIDIENNANLVEESVMSNMTNNSTPSTAYNNNTKNTATSNLTNDAYIKILDRLFLSDAKEAGPFLDGCNIYLTGFASNHRDRLNRILNVGGATRLDDLSEALTHVIVGDAIKASNDLKNLKEKGLSPHILNLKWLEESIKLKRPAIEENFLYKENTKPDTKQKIAEPPSPLSKKNLQMLQFPKVPKKPTFDTKKSTTFSPKHVEPDLLQQYLQNTVVDNDQLSGFNNSKINEIENENMTLVRVDEQQKSNQENQTMEKSRSINNLSLPADNISLSNKNTIDKTLFKGLTFILSSFDTEKFASLFASISEWGGKIVSESYSGIPDYGVVPIYGGSLKHTVNEIVTELFIEDCLNQEGIVEVLYYHQPISIINESNPLSKCVITMSTYTGVERIYLSTLAELLGARCQDTFARKTNTERNTYGSTHLVCPLPEGSKYNAAVKWKLPAVTADWLVACAVQSKFVDETPFLVGETIAQERSKNESEAQGTIIKEMRPPVERNIITPKRHLSSIQEPTSAETPLANPRLDLITSKPTYSPFHVFTPDTPYGQVFKANPSPATRKGWKEWIDSFPDIQIKEPPLKKRPLSTPLSELKRRLWQKMKEPLDEGNNSVATGSQCSYSESTPQPVNNDNEKKDYTTNIASDAPINRKLSFTDEESPLQKNQINLQLAQLEQALQRTNSTPENRKSVCEDIANKYVEPEDQFQKYITKDTQPDTVGWEDPRYHVPFRPSTRNEEPACSTLHEMEDDNDTQEELMENQDERFDERPLKRKFMLSGIKERAAFEKAIIALGGEVSTEANFDSSATHLLCIRPSRNEKMLGSIAAGKWVLHCMYLRDSEQEGKFLDEEEYEWGNPKSISRIPQPEGDMEKSIANAAYRWRLKLLKETGGAFKNMVALLISSAEKYDQLKRLIEAGSGVVLPARPPYDTSPSGKKITHCFVHQKQGQQSVEWAMLASKDILCFMPQYLSDLLTMENPGNPRDCVHPEFKKYLSLLPK